MKNSFEEKYCSPNSLLYLYSLSLHVIWCWSLSLHIVKIQDPTTYIKLKLFNKLRRFWSMVKLNKFLRKLSLHLGTLNITR